MMMTYKWVLQSIDFSNAFGYGAFEFKQSDVVLGLWKSLGLRSNRLPV